MSTFGYYPQALDVTVGALRIATRQDLLQTCASVARDPSVQAGWIYAPSSSRVFGLPHTHNISHSTDNDPRHIEFIVWVLSLVTGMRLTTTPAGFLDATPIEAGYDLVDFNATHPDIETALGLAERFWVTHSSQPTRPLQFAAAVHALFISHYPRALQFEQFVYLYTALDACFALSQAVLGPPPSRLHHRRLSWLCSQLGIPQPDWAKANPAAKNSEVSAIRNQTLHEALYLGQPLGFAVHDAGSAVNLVVEMQALTCRLLIALLGAPNQNSYVTSPVTTYQIHSLDLA